MLTIKLNSRLLFTGFCVLVSFIIPVTALATDCPCFTEKDVMRYASHPAKFACVSLNGDQGVMRMLVRGPYVAFFNIDTDSYQPEDLRCSAIVQIGGSAEVPKAVLLDRYVLGMSADEYHDCWTLIEDDDLPGCVFGE